MSSFSIQYLNLLIHTLIIEILTEFRPQQHDKSQPDHQQPQEQQPKEQQQENQT